MGFVSSLSSDRCLTALIVKRLSGSWRYASYAGLCWLIWIAAFDQARIGLNDPHVLGMALNLAGLYCFVRAPDSTRGLCWSAVVFAISLFVKQTLLAFPIAVGIQLLLTSRRRLGIWLGTAASACLILLLLTLAVDGSHLFDHLLVSRTYSLQDMANNTGKYLLFIQVAFVAALIWQFRNMSTNTGSGLSRVLIWSFACTHVMGAAASGGNGASVNHLFDGMVATALIAGVALPGLERLAEGTRFPQAFLAVLLIVPFFFSSIMVLPWRIPKDLARYKTESPQLEAEFATATNFLRTVPDPVLCESALVCFESGKAFTYDAFAVDQAIQTGHMPAQAVLDLIRGRQFQGRRDRFRRHRGYPSGGAGTISHGVYALTAHQLSAGSSNLQVCDLHPQSGMKRDKKKSGPEIQPAPPGKKTRPELPGVWEGRVQPVLEKHSLALALGVILLATIRIVSTYDVFSLTGDEASHVACGLEYLAKHVYVYETQHPPLARAMDALLPYLAGTRPQGVAGHGPEGDAIVNSQGHPELTVVLMRLGVLPFLWLASLVVYFWARRDFGNPVAVIATALFTMLPPVLAHAGFATTDMGLTACLGAAFYALVLWARETQRTSAPCARASAAAALTKFTALGYLPASAVFALLAYLVAERPPAGKLAALARERAAMFCWP